MSAVRTCPYVKAKWLARVHTLHLEGQYRYCLLDKSGEGYIIITDLGIRGLAGLLARTGADPHIYRMQISTSDTEVKAARWEIVTDRQLRRGYPALHKGDVIGRA